MGDFNYMGTYHAEQKISFDWGFISFQGEKTNEDAIDKLGWDFIVVTNGEVVYTKTERPDYKDCVNEDLHGTCFTPNVWYRQTQTYLSSSPCDLLDCC